MVRYTVEVCFAVWIQCAYIRNERYISEFTTCHPLKFLSAYKTESGGASKRAWEIHIERGTHQIGIENYTHTFFSVCIIRFWLDFLSDLGALNINLLFQKKTQTNAVSFNLSWSNYIFCVWTINKCVRERKLFSSGSPVFHACVQCTTEKKYSLHIRAKTTISINFWIFFCVWNGINQSINCGMHFAKVKFFSLLSGFIVTHINRVFSVVFDLTQLNFTQPIW